MISVSQGWIDNQNQQMRSLSDIRLSIFDKVSSTSIYFIQTLNGDKIKEYSINETGSIINKIVPDVEGVFSVFKSNDYAWRFAIGNVIRVEYGYLINGSWEYIEKGVYQITNCEIPENGLYATYTFKHIDYDLLISVDARGVIPNATPYQLWGELINDNTTRMNNGGATNNNLYQDFTDGMGWGIGECRIIDILQTMAQAMGRTLQIKGHISDTHYIDTNFIDVSLTAPTSSNYIISADIQYDKPEYENDIVYNYYELSKYSFKRADQEGGGNVYNIFNVSQSDDNTYIYFKNNFVPYDMTLTNKVPSSVSLNYTLYQNCFMVSKVIGDTTTTWSCFAKIYVAENTCKLIKVNYGGTQASNSKDYFQVDNALINANYYNLARAYLNKWGNEYEIVKVNYRFDPRLELFDGVKVRVGNRTRKGIVESYTMTYNGSFKGSATIRLVSALGVS